MAKNPNIGRAAMTLTVKAAQAEGKSASAWIREMRAKGLGYRRTTMLTDFANVGKIKRKEGLLKYVRKDYLPSTEIAQIKDWDMSREYTYRLKVKSREAPGEPVDERFVSVVSDKPLTPREMEEEILLQWGAWYGRKIQDILSVVAQTAIQRAP